MRGVSMSATMGAMVLVCLFALTTTAHSWTANVENATSCAIRVKVAYGALGSQSKEDFIAPNATKTFDTGADCPLTLYATHQERDGQGKCKGSYTINAQRCFMLNYSFNTCMHACWNTTWKIVGTTSDPNDMQRNP